MNRKHLPGTGIRWLSTARMGVALMVLSMALRMEAGSITGMVRAEGKKGADAEAQGGKYNSREFKFVERVNYAEMKDFVVYIEGAVGTNEPPSKPVQVITKRVL